MKLKRLKEGNDQDEQLLKVLDVDFSASLTGSAFTNLQAVVHFY